MIAREIPAFELQRKAYEILSRELGPAGLVRFLQHLQTGTGNYTRDREQWLASMTSDEIKKKLRGSRRNGKH